MKHLILVSAMILPQAASPDGTGFMDLTMPGTQDQAQQASPFGCPLQEPPAWKNDLPIRETYRFSLLSKIYEAIWIRNVEKAGSCSCENRVPPWDEADTIYQTLFANLEQSEQVSIRLKMGEVNRLRLREADMLCNEEHG